MSMQNFIAKFPKKEPSQDYDRLREQGLRQIQKLSYQHWTDYNLHDPGITILEALCYAITDLGYRSGYPIRDILTSERQGVAVNSGDFHTAREVLTSGPITFDDLRKLLIDIRGVRNAWVQPHCGIRYFLEAQPGLLHAEARPGHSELAPQNGLFEVFIERDAGVEREPRLVSVGPLSNTGLSGEVIAPDGAGLRFDVFHPVTLRFVRLYADSAGDVRLRLVTSDGSTLGERTVVVSADAAGSRVTLGFHVPTGQGYRLEALSEAGGPRLFRSVEATFPQSLRDVLVLTGSSHGGASLPGHCFFFGLQLTYAVVPSPPSGPTRRQLRVAPLEGDLSMPVPPAAVAVAFRAMRDSVLHALTLHVDIQSGQQLVLDVTGALGEVLASASLELERGGPVRVPIELELEAGERYTVSAKRSSAHVGLAAATFPLGEQGVLELTQGGPGADRLGFFEWELSHATQPEPSVLTSADLRLAALDRVHRHRNLCQDLVAIHELDTEQIAICADIEVTPGTDIDDVLARLFHELFLHVSPPVRFYTIEELRQRGLSAQQIFEGPRLDHGFIDDEEFSAIQRRGALKTSDVVHIAMRLEGVVAIKSLALLSFVDGELRAQEAWVLPLATDRFRAPAFAPELSKVVFYKHGLPYYPNRRRVADLVRQGRATELQSKLGGHAMDLPVPVGVHRALADYQPVQNELPVTYAVGRQRVPRSEPALRHAQSRQLKAYLMFFEQLLANHLAQLSHVNDLFSWTNESNQTYFTRAVAGILDREDITNDALLDAEYGGSEEQALQALIEGKAAAGQRKTRFLDHVLGRYGESLTEYANLMASIQREAAEPRLLDDKRALLSNYPQLGYERANGVDYRHSISKDNLSGLERRVGSLLGIRGAGRRHLAGHRLSIVKRTGRWVFVLKDEAGVDLFVSKDCESRATIEVLLDAAIELGSDAQNFRLAAGGHELARDCDVEDEVSDRVIGTTTSVAALSQVVAYFATVHEGEGLHVIEHVLLRPRSVGDPFMSVQLELPGHCDCVEVKDPYSFRLTVLLPSWPARFQDLRFRRLVEQTVRREAPAHVLPKICWISHESMRDMERRHDAFASALARLVELDAQPALEPAPPVVSGSLPLPSATHPAQAEYRLALAALIAGIEQQVNVYPLARLHDCEETSSDVPAVSLNNTSLGTF
jgi:hypothetical protein